MQISNEMIKKIRQNAEQRNKHQRLTEVVQHMLLNFIPKLDLKDLKFPRDIKCKPKGIDAVLAVNVADDGKLVFAKFNLTEYAVEIDENGKPSDNWTMIRYSKDGQEEEVTNLIFFEDHTFLNGNRYTGFMKYDPTKDAFVKHGIGALMYTDTSKAIRDVGEFKDDLLHGLGMEEMRNKNIYIGEFEKNKKHGKGYCASKYQKSGENPNVEFYTNFYDGEWQNDKRHGEGKSAEFLYNRSTPGYEGYYYEGFYQDDVHWGRATINFCNSKDSFEGHVKSLQKMIGAYTTQYDKLRQFGNFQMHLFTILRKNGFVTWNEKGDAYEGNFYNGLPRYKKIQRVNGDIQQDIYNINNRNFTIRKKIDASRYHDSDFDEFYYYENSKEIDKHQVSFKFQGDYLIEINVILYFKNRQEIKHVFLPEKCLDMNYLIPEILSRSQTDPENFPKEAVQNILNTLLFNGFLCRVNKESKKYEAAFEVSSIKDQLGEKFINNLQSYIDIKNDEMLLKNLTGFKKVGFNGSSVAESKNNSEKFLRSYVFALITSFLNATDRRNLGMTSKAMFGGYIDSVIKIYEGKEIYERIEKRIQVFGDYSEYVRYIHPVLHNVVKDLVESYLRHPGNEKQYKILRQNIYKEEEQVKNDDKEEVKESFQKGGQNHHLFNSSQQLLPLAISDSSNAKLDRQNLTIATGEEIQRVNIDKETNQDDSKIKSSNKAPEKSPER